MTLPELRLEAGAALALADTRRKPALRRADDPDHLLATDLPLASEEAAVRAFAEKMAGNGWTVTRRGGWLYLDHPLTPPAAQAGPRIAEGEVGCCLSLLERHPAGRASAEEVRALCKAAEAGRVPLERLCRAWHGQWAVLLRQHGELPGELFSYLSAFAQGGVR